MKKKLIIVVFLFVLAGVLFAAQLPAKDPFVCVSQLETQKANAAVNTMLLAVRKRDADKFQNSWVKELSMDKINEYCKPLADQPSGEFIATQSFAKVGAPDTVIIIGTFDTNPHSQKIVLKKSDDSYRIAEINELN